MNATKAPNKKNTDDSGNRLEKIENELTHLQHGLQKSMQETMLVLSEKERTMERWTKLRMLFGPAETISNALDERILTRCLSVVECAAESIAASNLEKTRPSTNSSSSGNQQNLHMPSLAGISTKMDLIRKTTAQREGKIRNLLDEMKAKLNENRD